MMRHAPTTTLRGVFFTNSLGALRVAPKHIGIDEILANKKLTGGKYEETQTV